MIVLLPLMTLNSPDEQDFMLALLDEYGTLMYATARRFTDEHTAEDVVQESLVKLIDHVQTIMHIPRCNLAGYIVNTVKNTARNQLRTDRIRRKYIDEDTSPEEFGGEAAYSPELLVLRREDSRNFYQVWAMLPEADRDLLESRYILGKTDEELAHELGCKPDSIRMKLTRARRRAMAAYKEWKSDDQTGNTV